MSNDIVNYLDPLIENDIAIENALKGHRKRELQIMSDEIGVSAKKFLNKKEYPNVMSALQEADRVKTKVE